MQKTFKFVEAVYADRDGSERVEVPKGTTFTATMAEEVVWDRRGKEPKEVRTGRLYVESSDLDVLPGCLTSCIRTGRAEEVGADAKKKAKKTAKAAA